MKKTIDGVTYKVWKLPNLLLLHWVLNPGLAVNELVLGQRIPRESLLREGEGSMTERSHIQCPSCETVHHGMLWSEKRAFGHYNGLYCPTCEAKIPQLLNVFSILVLIITFPIWKPLQMVYGERFKARSLAKVRMSPDEAKALESQPVNFVSMGMFFGIAMGLYFGISNGIANGFSMRVVTIALISGVAAGVLFGTLMWLFLRGKKAKS